MRYFSPNGDLGTSSLPLRVTLTGFLIFVLFGYTTSFALLVWKTGLSPTGIARYYRGYEAPPGSLEAFQYAKEFPELLENTHFHVFTVPVILLILTHVFFMTPVADRTKIRLTLLAYGAAGADLAAPWLVRYVGAGFAWWKLASVTALHATLILLALACLRDAWRSPPTTSQDLSGGGAPEDPEPR